MKTLHDAAQLMVNIALTDAAEAKKVYQADIDKINSDFMDGILTLDTYNEMIHQARIRYYVHLEVAIEHIKREWED